LVDATPSTTLFTLTGLEHEAEELLGVRVSVLTPGFLPPKFRDRVLQTGTATMKHPERIEDYLEHISESIDRATEYLRSIDNFEAFKQQRRDQDAIIRNCPSIIGTFHNSAWLKQGSQKKLRELRPSASEQGWSGAPGTSITVGQSP
jgi:hypothetical protein